MNHWLTILTLVPFLGGIIIAGLVNMFLGSPAVQFAISIITLAAIAAPGLAHASGEPSSLDCYFNGNEVSFGLDQSSDKTTDDEGSTETKA